MRGRERKEYVRKAVGPESVPLFSGNWQNIPCLCFQDFFLFLFYFIPGRNHVYLVHAIMHTIAVCVIDTEGEKSPGRWGNNGAWQQMYMHSSLASHFRKYLTYAKRKGQQRSNCDGLHAKSCSLHLFLFTSISSECISNQFVVHCLERCRMQNEISFNLNIISQRVPIFIVTNSRFSTVPVRIIFIRNGYITHIHTLSSFLFSFYDQVPF